MDEQNGDYEYSNCENRGQSLYFIPDSYNDDSEYMVARSTGLVHRTESEYELTGEERSSVKTFVSKFEETLNFHKNETLELKQRYLKAEVQYANIPHTLRAWKSSERVPGVSGHGRECDNEAGSDPVYYANDVCIRSLNERCDRNEESSFSHTANDTASLIGRRARNPSDDSESYCEMQQKDRKGHIKLFDKDSRTECVGEIECQSKKPEARIASRITEPKSYGVTVQEVTANKPLVHVSNSEIRSCEGGELIRRGTVVKHALDVARKMQTYLNEISDRVEVPLYENDVKTFIGVANTLKCHIKEVGYQNESRYPIEAPGTTERLEIGQLYQQQSSQNYTSKEGLETNYEEQFDQIARELEAIGKKALARRGTEDVENVEEEERISKGYILTRKSKICFLLTFFIVLVAWTVLLYVAVHEKYITIK